MKYLETTCKSMLVKSKLPDTDYVVNPYMGCEFGCGYCYASFMGRFVNEPVDSWGEYVYVKTNAVEVFDRELSKMSAKQRHATILLSSVTDAWQGVERKYRLSRGIVNLLADCRYPGVVSILTKSPIILDDVETIAALPNADVGITITTTEDPISRMLELRAPSSSRRIRTLAELNRHGIRTYAFIGPLLPHFRLQPEKLEELFSTIYDTGTRELYVELINTSQYIRKRLDKIMKAGNVAIVEAYNGASDDVNRAALAELVMKLVDKFGFALRMERVIDHRKDSKAASR